ncbi:MAG TPA: glycosyltransferase [Clostridiaceae bacterium]|nr:glycosyltransferase [Clostridiaceae bacterium]
MRISLCMIVKNEEENIINCLERALQVADEAIVVDTGSTDKTIELLKGKYGNDSRVKILEEEWENDFSKARNKSLEYATGDWILILDADERIFCDREKLEAFLMNSNQPAYNIPIYNIYNKNSFVVSAAMIRLYKNNNPIYKGAIHEQLEIDGKSYAGEVIDKDICKIYHYGYSSSVFQKKDKSRRNMDIIKEEIQKDPEDPFNWYNKGVMEMIGRNYEEALDDFIKSHELCNGVRRSFDNDLLIRMIQCIVMLKNYEQAAIFIESISKDVVMKNMPDIYYYLGVCYAKLEKYDEAIKNFQKAVDIGECNNGISYFGAGSFLSMIEWAKALELKGEKLSAIEKYMEAVFNENNIGKQGLDELRRLLKEENLTEELNQLEKMLSNDDADGSNANDVENSIIKDDEFERYKKEVKESIRALVENGMISEAKEGIKEYENVVKNDADIYSIKGVIAMMEGNPDEAEKILIDGLDIDETNFDLLYNLGYLYQSTDKTELAIEYYKRALQNARDEDGEKEAYEMLQSLGIKESMAEITSNKIPKTSIIILTYNNLYYNKLCIESIKKYTPEGTYEIIVVDNNSTDGTVEWLKEQKGIKLILNDENLGFPKACNQGIKASQKDNDILLLNNDVIVTPNWLTNLKKCLYASADTGAVGLVTNSCSNYQTIPVNYSNLDEMINFAKRNNISNEAMWEERLRLIGFCILIKNEVVRKIGLLDEMFSPGNFEDDDYSLRIRKAGYRLMLCRDSFIHHFGSVSFGKVSYSLSKLLDENRNKFYMKWGVDPCYFADIKREITELISRSGRNEINVLHIGCAGGATLLDIKNAIPSARLYGIEPVKEAIVGPSYFAHIVTGNVEKIKIYQKNYFDYIINSILQENEEDIIEFLKTANDYLKSDGVVYITSRNKTGWDVKFIKRLQERTNDYSFNIVSAANGKQVLSAEKRHGEVSGSTIKLTLYRKEELDRLLHEAASNFGTSGEKDLINIIRRLDGNVDFERNLERLRDLIAESEPDCERIVSIILKHGIHKAKLLNIMGIVYYQLNDFNSSLMLLKEAFKLDEENTDTIYNIAYVLHKANENVLALDFLNGFNGIENDTEIYLLKRQIEEAI